MKKKLLDVIYVFSRDTGIEYRMDWLKEDCITKWQIIRDVDEKDYKYLAGIKIKKWKEMKLAVISQGCMHDKWYVLWMCGEWV